MGVWWGIVEDGGGVEGGIFEVGMLVGGNSGVVQHTEEDSLALTLMKIYCIIYTGYCCWYCGGG